MLKYSVANIDYLLKDNLDKSEAVKDYELDRRTLTLLQSNNMLINSLNSINNNYVSHFKYTDVMLFQIDLAMKDFLRETNSDGKSRGA